MKEHTFVAAALAMLFGSHAMSAKTLTSALLRVAMALALAWLAITLFDVLLVVFAGVLLAVVLRGLADLLGRYTRLPPGWSLLVVLVVMLAALVAFVVLAIPEVGRQFDELVAQLPGAVQKVTSKLEQTEWGRWVLGRASKVGQWLARPEAMQSAQQALSTTLGAGAGVVVLLFVGVYVAAQPGLYLDNGLRLLPAARRPRARAIAGECGATLRWWMVGMVASMTIIGIATWVGLLVLGVPLALVLAVLAAILTFIPNFGPILAAVPAILLGLSQGTSTALWVLGLYVGIQAVESNAITPLIQRRAVSLPPALTIVAQMIMGALAGVLGVIMATPLIALTLVLVRRLHVDRMDMQAYATTPETTPKTEAETPQPPA